MSPYEVLLTENQRYVHQNQEQKQLIEKLQSEVTFLQERIAWFERQIFGQKRERHISDDTQIELDLGIERNEEVDTTERIEYDRKKSNGKRTPHGREEIPPHLPRIRIPIHPDFDTTGMEQIGEKITEELHYKAAEFYVKQLVRPVFATIQNGFRTVVCPQLPPRCIEKGKAGASLVAQTIVTKCVDHIPLYRFKQQIDRSCDMHIAQSTIDGWFSRGAFWFEPVDRRLQEIIRAHDYAQLDETSVQVMIRPTKGKSHRGYMWLCSAPELKCVTFNYFHTRNKDGPGILLGPDYQGIVQTDGLEVYSAFCSKSTIIHAGCMYHARRGFKDALGNDRERASWMLDKIQLLSKIEEKAKVEGYSPEERLVLRQEESSPIMSEMKQWLTDNLMESLPKGGIGKAIKYMYNRWDELSRFLSDGRIEISTNFIENCVRPFAIGRKNWLFCGSESGARRLASVYSVLATAKLNGLNPFEYANVLLEELPKRTANNIDDLLPHIWKPQA